MLKLNIEVIRGYESAGEMFLAMQRGEIDGQAIGLSAAKIRQSTMWDKGQLRVLIQFARETRHAEVPDAPTGRELVSDPDDLALLMYAEAPFRMALPFVAPPGVPADRAKALQTAFCKPMKTRHSAPRPPSSISTSARSTVRPWPTWSLPPAGSRPQ